MTCGWETGRRPTSVNVRVIVCCLANSGGAPARSSPLGPECRNSMFYLKSRTSRLASPLVMAKNSWPSSAVESLP
jgi:hypothetical protein